MKFFNTIIETTWKDILLHVKIKRTKMAIVARAINTENRAKAHNIRKKLERTK